MRWLLLDEVISVERRKKAQSRSHVPDVEVSAEFLMIEMMAQTGALLVGAEKDFSEDLVFAKIESAVFFPYKTGDSLEIAVSAEQLGEEGGWLDAEMNGPNGPAAKARLLLMNVGHLVQGSTKSITFHEAFMTHFKIREKVR